MIFGCASAIRTNYFVRNWNDEMGKVSGYYRATIMSPFGNDDDNDRHCELSAFQNSRKIDFSPET